MKHKYYFKKPKSEIAKDIMLGLALAGAVVMVSALSPHSTASALLRIVKNRKKKYPRKKYYDVFYRLRKQGYIVSEIHNNQLYVSLTPEGKKKAGRFQIDALLVAKPKKWDKKWRIIIFDVQDKHRTKREALRGFLKRLSFHQLQKSVWIHPYNCEDEVRILEEFFGFTKQELQFIVADHVDSDAKLRQHFKLAAQ